MHLRPRSALDGSARRRAGALLTLALLAGCSARSSLPGDGLDAGALDGGARDGDASPEKRGCPPECAVGHACCVGSCDGPAVEMPSDCCSCLQGEVSSGQCPDGTCGG